MNDPHQKRDGVPGCEWRLLTHETERSFEIANRGVFDELVVDPWLHIEKMNDRQWWLRIGDARIWVHIGENGSPAVDIERGCYADIKGTTTTHSVDSKR